MTRGGGRAARSGVAFDHTVRDHYPKAFDMTATPPTNAINAPVIRARIGVA